MTEMRDALSPEEFAAVERTGHGRWSQTDLLVAGVHDRLAELAWLYSTVNAGKGQKPPRPKPLPRPGVDPSGHRHVPTLEERLASVDPRVRAIADAMRNRQPIPPELL